MKFKIIIECEVKSPDDVLDLISDLESDLRCFDNLEFKSIKSEPNIEV